MAWHIVCESSVPAEIEPNKIHTIPMTKQLIVFYNRQHIEWDGVFFPVVVVASHLGTLVWYIGESKSMNSEWIGLKPSIQCVESTVHLCLLWITLEYTNIWIITVSFFPRFCHLIEFACLLAPIACHRLQYSHKRNEFFKCTNNHFPIQQ